MNTANATHTRANPNQRDGGMGSCITNTPHENWRMGARYWSMPIVTSGTSFAPAPNSSNGIAVTTPADASSAAWPKPWPVNVPPGDTTR
ncbi:hypothetical protein GCM10022243_04230 [Saccharothrix violaceirubra]